MSAPARAPLLALALVACGSTLAAQESAAGRLIAIARAQLDVPNPDSAARLLERAVDLRLGPSRDEQVRAWVLYGIAQIVRSQLSGQDLAAVARNAFRHALELSPSEQVDSLNVFGDDVSRLFNAERANLAGAAPVRLALELVAPADTLIPPDGHLPILARPSARARVVLTLGPADNVSSTIWTDTIPPGGTAAGWSPRAPAAGVVTPGRYALRATATDSAGQVFPTVERILIVSRAAADTQPLPPPLDPTTFAPETLHLRRGPPTTLLWGFALGAAIAGASQLLGNPDVNNGLSADGTAYAVAGGVSLAGVVSWMTGRRARPLPENIERNRVQRENDRRQREAITRANATARERADVRVTLERTGP